MSKFKRLIAIPCVIIFIGLYLIGVNLIKKIDRVDNYKEAVPYMVNAENSSKETPVKEEKKDNQRQEEFEAEVSEGDASLSEKININTAGVEELVLLDGIGEKTALKIIEKREEIGGFESIEQIKDVSGIGDEKFEDMKDYITVE